MRNKISLLMVLGLFLGSGALHAAQYAADMITTTSGQRIEAKISVKENKTRVEMVQMIMINRGDLGVSWMVMLGQGMYMENPYDAAMAARTSKNVAGETERVSLGKEKVDGQPAEKFKVTYTSAGNVQSMYQWIGSKDIPVKMESIDGSWDVEFRNVRTDGISDDLFEVPAGYQKMTMPSMAGMTGMGNAGAE